MVKVLVSDTLSEVGLEVLRNAEGIEVEYKPGLSEVELAEAIKDADGLIIRSGSKVTAQVIEAAAKLKAVGRAGIGVDNIDVPAASRRGIVVMNTPTGNATTTAEHALSLLFAVARKIPQAAASMKEGKWEKKKFQGRELSGKTLGIIGLGNIGRIVADRARGLHMEVIGFDPVVTASRAAELGIELVSLDELFARADAITAHAPLTASTKNIVDDAAIAKMKDGVLLINAARGGIYDEAAVIRGLDSGKVGGAALDVYASEPPGLTDAVKHPQIVTTPHLGASTSEAQERVALEIAQQIVAYLKDGTVTNSVNVPSVPREMAKVLGPYVLLARRLGCFLAQVESLEPANVEVECAGEASTLTIAPIVNSALSGLLEAFLHAPVNEVNAPFMAKDRGVAVSEQRSSHAGEFATLVTLRVSDAAGKVVQVAGTLAADKTPRLAGWGDHPLDAMLEGHILAMRNYDQPGVIGRIGSLLGQAQVNISRMQIGLDTPSREAASIWALDSELPEKVLAEIAEDEDVRRAYAVTL